MDELTMISFVGLYILVLGVFIYNFYLSKKMYVLLGDIGEVIAIMAETRDHKMPPREDTMKRLVREGIELEHGD